MQPKIKRAKFEESFDPLGFSKRAEFREIKWVLPDRTPSSEEVTEPEQLLEDIGGVLAGDRRTVDRLPFRDPDSFKAGEIHAHRATWKKL